MVSASLFSALSLNFSIVFLAAGIAAAEAGEVRPMPVCGTGKRITCVVDGDTLWINSEKIRLAGIDAPETSRAKCAAERTKGAAAREALATMMAGRTAIIRRGADPYGRTLATVLVDGRDIGAAMVAAGFAKPWRGRTEKWCRKALIKK